MRNIISFVFVFISIYAVIGERAVDEPAFEIRDGNCSVAVADDLVFSKNCHKVRIPFISREGTERYSGMKTIYCILALSEKEEYKGSTVEITSGGVGNYSVDFEMISAVNHGYEYDLSVYAK